MTIACWKTCDRAGLWCISVYLQKFSPLSPQQESAVIEEEGKTLITTDEMIDKFYNAIFVDQYDGRKYNTTLGQYEFTKESKGFAISASSMLSRFAELS